MARARSNVFDSESSRPSWFQPTSISIRIRKWVRSSFSASHNRMIVLQEAREGGKRQGDSAHSHCADWLAGRSMSIIEQNSKASTKKVAVNPVVYPWIKIQALPAGLIYWRLHWSVQTTHDTHVLTVHTDCSIHRMGTTTTGRTPLQ